MTTAVEPGVRRARRSSRPRPSRALMTRTSTPGAIASTARRCSSTRVSTSALFRTRTGSAPDDHATARYRSSRATLRSWSRPATTKTTSTLAARTCASAPARRPLSPADRVRAERRGRTADDGGLALGGSRPGDDPIADRRHLCGAHGPRSEPAGHARGQLCLIRLDVPGVSMGNEDSCWPDVAIGSVFGDGCRERRRPRLIPAEGLEGRHQPTLLSRPVRGLTSCVRSVIARLLSCKWCSARL